MELDLKITPEDVVYYGQEAVIYMAVREAIYSKFPNGSWKFPIVAMARMYDSSIVIFRTKYNGESMKSHVTAFRASAAKLDTLVKIYGFLGITLHIKLYFVPILLPTHWKWFEEFKDIDRR